MKNNYIHYFDIIGGSLDFNYRNGSFKTSLGGILSLIMLIILCLLIFAFGRDFYKRINPEFIKQTLVPEKELMPNKPQLYQPTSTLPIYINYTNYTLFIVNYQICAFRLFL